MLLNREQILNADDIKYKDISTEEWQAGSSVRVKVMTGTERDAFEQAAYLESRDKDKEGGVKAYRAKLLTFTIVDDKMKLLFTMKDIEALGAKSSVPLDRLSTAAMTLNGLLAADVDEVIKN